MSGAPAADPQWRRPPQLFDALSEGLASVLQDVPQCPVVIIIISILAPRRPFLIGKQSAETVELTFGFANVRTLLPVRRSAA